MKFYKLMLVTTILCSAFFGKSYACDLNEEATKMTHHVRTQYNELVFYAGGKQAQQLLGNAIERLELKNNDQSWRFFLHQIITGSKDTSFDNKSSDWKRGYVQFIKKIDNLLKIIAHYSSLPYSSPQNENIRVNSPMFDHWSSLKTYEAD